MKEEQRERIFVELSALLTGFHPKVLRQTDRVEEYLPHASKCTGAALNDLLEACHALLEDLGKKTGCRSVECMALKVRQEAIDTLMKSLPPKLVQTALAITKLWYLGSWYQPFDHVDEETKKTREEDLNFGEVVSDESYLEGLVWQVLQSHPMGKAEMGHIYWSKKPSRLAAFTGHADSQGALQ